MRITALVTIAAISLLALCPAYPAGRNAGSIEISANPNAIAADGKSVCTITAQVRDPEGNIVPDETEIRFTTSLGVIEESARTSAGVARVKLVSADIAGTAMITATWLEGQAVAQAQVEFGVSSSAMQGPQYIDVAADEYLGYSADFRVLDALGNVKIRYRSIKLEAAAAQVDLNAQRIVAKGDAGSTLVKIYAGDKVIEGNMFYCDFQGSGVLLSATAGKIMQLDLTKADPVVADKEVAYFNEQFDFADLSESSVLIKAKEATVFLNEKIQFKSAKVYVNGKRMLALPLYVLSMNGYEVDGEQYLGYGTSGITLNLPFYYSLTPSSTGAILLRHGSSSGWGWYGQQPGWGLDVRQKYATEHASGKLEFTRVTSGDWGAHFTHDQEIDKDTRAYLFLDYPAHEDLFGNLSLDRSFKRFNVGLNLYGSKYSTGGSLFSGDLHAQTRGKQIGDLPLKYTVSGRLSYQRNKSESLFGPAETQEGLTPSVNTSVYTSPLPIRKNLSLAGSAGLGYIWGTDGSPSGLSTLGTARLDWKMSSKSNVQLSYRYAQRASVYATSSGTQSLALHWRFNDRKRLQTSLYAIKGLDYSSINLFADINYKLDPKWRLGLRTTYNSFSGRSYDDLELAVGHMIGDREIVAVWSQSRKKIMFELGSGGF